MERFKILYYYDNTEDNVLDISRLVVNGFTISGKLNSIHTASLKISYRNLINLTRSKSIRLDDLLCEWFSTVQIWQGDSRVFTGVLDKFPSVSGSGLDEEVELTFEDGLGLCRGFAVAPLQILNGNLDALLSTQVAAAIAVASNGRDHFPLKLGSHRERLANVTWTVDSYMKLNEFLVQRCDNTTGAGQFDINFTPLWEFEIWHRFGVDISDSMIFQIGGQGGNMLSFDFDAWSNFATDAVMTGAGNGFGSGGTTLVSNRFNAESRRRHFYYKEILQNSSILDQGSLNSSCEKALKYTSSPCTTGSVTFNATNMGVRVREHAQNGDIWIGDVVTVKTGGIYQDFPVSANGLYRISQLDITVDRQNVETVKATFIDPTGGVVSES